MELRQAVLVVSALGLALFAQGCADACDEYADNLESKLVECGMEVPEPDPEAEELPEPVCTDAKATQADCWDACFQEGCGAIDGSDQKAAQEFGACRDKCPVAGL
jgi:hypothetical protein